eukprot:4131855-Alexandrium_andersonii.AAC.1
MQGIRTGQCECSALVIEQLRAASSGADAHLSSFALLRASLVRRCTPRACPKLRPKLPPLSALYAQ